MTDLTQKAKRWLKQFLCSHKGVGNALYFRHRATNVRCPDCGKVWKP